MTNFTRFGLGMLLAAGAGLAAAQTVYKQQLPDGRTVYSDKVQPHAKVEKALTTSELTVVAPLATSKEIQANDAQRNAQAVRRDLLWRERNLAQGELDAARMAKAGGEEPGPGDRIGTVSHRSRLSDAYWARQDALRSAVDSAQRRLERAERNLRDAGS